ncbi:MAG: choline TMA-lyase-activating enzyme [Desulfotalea sp.]|nr:MAG: choline TMA-lyase-activating enzyme [Desulfotalea sp.]
MIERKARIFNIQKYNMYDGPGIRTLVFFKGCPLRCHWCSNPESQKQQYQVMFKENQCVNCAACVSACPVGVHRVMAGGKHKVDRTIECIGCRACETACPESALAIMGEMKTISELMDVIAEDKPFYDTSGGGVTLGGGEVLMQPEAATSLLMACKQRGINTAIETCGYARLKVIQKIAPYTDLFLFDVKHMNSERHHELTGVRNEMILGNLKWLLENRYNVKIRMPLLKGINDGDREIEELIEFLKEFKYLKNFKGVDLLPYHKMGINKYSQLDIKYPIEGEFSLDNADLERIENCIKKYNFPVSIIRH